MRPRRHDVFNGDADGICAARQLRLADPADAQVVTGLKRDIELVKRVRAEPGDLVTVLDVSLDRNREALMALLGRGVRVRYFDHHFAGVRPVHPGLELVIDESGDACTSVLVDRYLSGQFRAWAVVGAFGDNLPETAAGLARALGLDRARLEALSELGANLNYNAYGESESDVLIAPAELYRTVSRHADPLRLCAEEPVIAKLGQQRHADLERAAAVPASRRTPGTSAWLLPDAPWSRRVSGAFANALAAGDAQRAHAVLTPRSDGGYIVSVRTPAGRTPEAAQFCRRYATGGGRARSAGIDRLGAERLEGFLAAFESAWSASEKGREPAACQ